MINLRKNTIIILKEKGYVAFIKELKQSEEKISSAIVNFYFPKKYSTEYTINQIEDDFLLTSEFFEDYK